MPHQIIRRRKLATAVASVSVVAIFCAATATADDAPIRLSEPVASTATTETFGTALPAGEPISLAELVNNADEHLGKARLVDARVSKVCQKKGCFFIASDGKINLRVAFRDYGFFVPTDSGGKTVTLAGELIRRELTEDEAEHYTADLGEGATTIAPGERFEIVASAVRLPREATPES